LDNAPPVAVGCDHVVVPTDSGSWYPRSFLLTDIVGSVALWERDATGMSEAVARHEENVGGAVAAAGGELVRAKGEGTLSLRYDIKPRATHA